MTELMIFIWGIGVMFTSGIGGMLNKKDLSEARLSIHIVLFLQVVSAWPYVLGVHISKLSLTSKRYK